VKQSKGTTKSKDPGTKENNELLPGEIKRGKGKETHRPQNKMKKETPIRYQPVAEISLHLK
jgi:hypothetical protein